MEPKTARNRHVSILCSCSPESFNGTDISRSIVLCLAYSLEPTFPTALSNVLDAGGKGLIVAQFTINVLEITKDCSGIICVLVDFDTGYQIGKLLFSESSPDDHGFLEQPDVAAPGVSILAAERDGFNFGSGTSAACPHVSGVVALLKSLHPDWSHAAVKSALVTTGECSKSFFFPRN
ncbi:hypothetical protein BHE74_00038193 [Ensete ventricosum]|nr:hypothetical protein BHE74_00038193 [Ensete ventricosum]